MVPPLVPREWGGGGLRARVLALGPVLAVPVPWAKKADGKS